MPAYLTSVLRLLFCLLGAGAILTSAQDWDSCDSLQHYVDRHPNCNISNYGEPCSGLFCYDYVSFSYYYDFIVQKCEDPVTVDVFVYLDSHDNVSYYDYFNYLYNQSETVDSPGHYNFNGSYTAIMERNASHLGFELYLEHDKGSGDVKWLFDAVYIPLDPADCMCSSMENVAADIHLTTNYSCNTTAVCNVITCDVRDSPLRSVDVTVNPCPPSLDVNIDILGRVRKIHANGNTTTSLGSVGVTLILTLWHYDYSMDVELTAVGNTTTEIILSRHKIILDLTGCGPPHHINISSESTEAPTEFTEPTIPSTTNITYNTCEALHSISVVDGNLCSTNPACNALECEIVNQRLEMAVDSCHDPPGIRLVVYDSTNHPVFNRSFYNGSHIVHNRSLPFNLNVTVLQIPPSAISVEITGESFGYKIPLVPKTVIPIDQSSCSTLQPPTSAPGTTCSAMQYIQSALARRLPSTFCYFPLQHNCTVLTCSVEEGVDMTIRLLRCAHPPAVRVTLGNSFLTYFDHTFDHSEVIPLDNIPNVNNVSLNVTMDQLCPSDVGFQMDVLNGVYNSPLIPYTIIPVNTTGCGPSGSGMVCPSITTTPPTLSSTLGLSSTMRFSLPSSSIGSSLPSSTTELGSTMGFSVPSSTIRFSLPSSSMGFSMPSSTMRFSLPSTTTELGSTMGFSMPNSTMRFSLPSSTIGSTMGFSGSSSTTGLSSTRIPSHTIGLSSTMGFSMSSSTMGLSSTISNTMGFSESSSTTGLRSTMGFRISSHTTGLSSTMGFSESSSTAGLKSTMGFRISSHTTGLSSTMGFRIPSLTMGLGSTVGFSMSSSNVGLGSTMGLSMSSSTAEHRSSTATELSTTSECSGVMCSTVTAISPSPSPAPPKSPFAISCDAMQNISEQLNKSNFLKGLTCVHKECGQVDCSMKIGEINIILHCSPPAGMEMKIHTNSTQALSESELFSESGSFFEDSMDVTVNIIDGKILGYGVVYLGHTLVSYTLIPLDTCGDSSNPDSNSGGLSTAALVSAIAVPVTLLLIVAVVVIIVGMYLVRRRRRRHYQFQRMAMCEMDDI